jgi:hypothetical protein
VIEEPHCDYKMGEDDSSDHISFAKAGVPAVLLMDMDADVYHVPEDTIDNIGIANLTRDVDIAMNLIGRFS